MLDTIKSVIRALDATILETCNWDTLAYVDDMLETTRSLILTLDAIILETCSCDMAA